MTAASAVITYSLSLVIRPPIRIEAPYQSLQSAYRVSNVRHRSQHGSGAVQTTRLEFPERLTRLLRNVLENREKSSSVHDRVNPGRFFQLTHRQSLSS